MNEFCMSTSATDGALASFGSGDGPGGGTYTMNERGKGNSGRRVVKPGPVRNSLSARAGRQGKVAGHTPKEKRLIKAIQDQARSGRLTNKQVAENSRILVALRKLEQGRSNKSANARIGKAAAQKKGMARINRNLASRR